MARRLGRRKRPKREKYAEREQLVIEEGVFDTRTMLRLRKLFTHRIIERLIFLVGKGKEADTYVAEAGKEAGCNLVAVKIFRIETSSFESRKGYMIGDPRFSRIKLSMYSIVNEWCKKEFGNLKIAQAAGIHAPRPLIFSGNVLAMEFIEDNGAAAQMLKNTVVERPEEVIDAIIDDIKKLYEHNLVHADVSEYNVLMKGGVPYLIDFGQAVVIKHPNAANFLARDIRIITGYFDRKYGVKRDPEEVFKRITG